MPETTTEIDLQQINRRFFDGLWSDADFVAPSRFNTWPLVQSLLPRTAARLEVAPGLRPRLPLLGTQFVDLSPAAVCGLAARGATALVGLISSLPFARSTFDLVCAFDVVEHVDNDDDALRELARVTTPGGTLLLSVPLHPGRWTTFDDLVGHRRRYEPQRLLACLLSHGFTVEQSAIYGMQPRSPRLLGAASWFLTRHRTLAMRWYNRVFMPLGLRLQKPLDLVAGMSDAEDVDELFLVCRKSL